MPDEAKPLDVRITEEQPPIPVTIAPAPAPVPITKAERLTLPPTTTQAEDDVTAGQRRINIIWEVTQAIIAIGITAAIIFCAVSKITSQDLTNAFFLIVGFYFSRTNHQAVGGVGRKPAMSPYEGR